MGRYDGRTSSKVLDTWGSISNAVPRIRWCANLCSSNMLAHCSLFQSREWGRAENQWGWAGPQKCRLLPKVTTSVSLMDGPVLGLTRVHTFMSQVAPIRLEWRCGFAILPYRVQLQYQAKFQTQYHALTWQLESRCMLTSHKFIHTAQSWVAGPPQQPGSFPWVNLETRQLVSLCLGQPFCWHRCEGRCQAIQPSMEDRIQLWRLPPIPSSTHPAHFPPSSALTSCSKNVQCKGPANSLPIGPKLLPPGTPLWH